VNCIRASSWRATWAAEGGLPDMRQLVAPGVPRTQRPEGLVDSRLAATVRCNHRHTGSHPSVKSGACGLTRMASPRPDSYMSQGLRRLDSLRPSLPTYKRSLCAIKHTGS
jgi:hypothetical protein